MTESTREKILSYSLPYFVVNGYKKTKVDDLAQQIGITKKTIYNYFNSKQDLLIAGVEFDSNRVIQKVEPLINDNSISFSNRLGILFFLTYFKIEERKNLFPDVNPFKPPSEILTQLIGRIQSELLNFVKNLLTEGIKANHFREDLNIECTSNIILSMLVGIPNFNCNNEIPSDPNHLILESVKMVVRGITTDKGLKAFDPTQIEPFYRQWIIES